MVEVGETVVVWLIPTFFDPFHPFDAVQELALVTDHVSMTDDHERISVLEAVKDQIEVAVRRDDTEEQRGVPSASKPITTPLLVQLFQAPLLPMIL
ncbi:hypothetical protein KC711_06070 [Candidatus Peregrinibacteria bacterium]|nr:hypothetical protein [Candidatus Peregrinibacteria bacterium]